MCSLPFLPFVITVSTLVCLFRAGNSVVLAQTSTLKLCSETIQKARQAVDGRKSPDQAFFTGFDPTHQKLQQSQYDWAVCVKGQKAPLTPFRTLTGESYDTSSLAGKVIVLNFWFMSCAPCRAEFSAFNRLVDEYKGKNVLFLGFTPDKADRLKPAFFEQNRFDFNIVADAQRVASSFFITGYPTTYIIDQRGIISQAWVGFAGNGMDKLAPYYTAKAAIDALLTTAGK